MYARILILKEYWGKITDVDNPKVVFATGVFLLIFPFALLLIAQTVQNNFIYFINGMWFAVFGFLAVSMFIETHRMIQNKRNEGHYYSWLNIFYMDKMKPQEFERFIAWIFRKLGYECTVLNKGAHEHGADIVAQKDGQKTIIQVKRYNGRKVGIDGVNQVLKGREFYNPNKVILITNSRFSKPAKLLAKECGVELIDRAGVVALYKQAKEIYKHEQKSRHKKH